MRVLLITPHLTGKPNSGGTQVTWDRYQALRAQHEVFVLCMKADNIPEVEQWRVLQAGHLRPRTAKGLLASYAEGLPLSVWRNATPEFLNTAVWAYADEAFVDAVYVDHWLMWPAAEFFKEVPRILHLHNAEHLLFSRAAERMSGLTALAAKLEGWRAKRYLAKICAEANEVHYLSGEDVRLSEQDGIVAKNTLVFPPQSEPALPEEVRHAPKRNQLLTVGSMSWEPTRAGMKWFLANSWAALAKEGLSLNVGGKGADAELEQMLREAPQVAALGFVENVNALYAEAKVFIAPLLDGSGIKIKILNSLAHGVPVVTTSVGVEGFPRGFEAFIRVADTPESFSREVLNLNSLSDEDWQRLSLQGRRYVREHFSGSQFASWVRGLNTES